MDELIYGEKGDADTDAVSDITYHTEKDFYKGMGGELRLKAEGLFKKAKEKGISLEDIEVSTMSSNHAEFPGIGSVELPAYMVKVRGRDMQTGQVIIDGKQIDYFNRYQKYLGEKIHGKNVLLDERGRVIKENRKPKTKPELDLYLDDWERFEVGRELLEDKEFGLEKTITGACDRVIRKLMGENDWLYPEEARLLDEEFNLVQSRIAREQDREPQSAKPAQMVQKKATDRQISYLKARIKNAGLDPEKEEVIREVLRISGSRETDLRELSTAEMSRLIDGIAGIIPQLPQQGNTVENAVFSPRQAEPEGRNLKQ